LSRATLIDQYRSADNKKLDVRTILTSRNYDDNTVMCRKRLLTADRPGGHNVISTAQLRPETMIDLQLYPENDAAILIIMKPGRRRIVQRYEDRMDMPGER